MSSYISKRVLCPFYKDAPFGKQSVICEGVEQNSSIHLAFGNRVHHSLYMEQYCCKDYDSCRIANMLYQKYEEDEKKDD